MLPVYASRTSRRRASSSSILHSFSWASLLHRALTYTTTIPHLYFAAPMHNVSSLFSLSVPLCSPPPSAYTETLSCVPRYIHHHPICTAYLLHPRVQRTDLLPPTAVICLIVSISVQALVCHPVVILQSYSRWLGLCAYMFVPYITDLRG